MKLASTRPGGWFFTTITPPLDRLLLRKSQGRYSLAGIAAPTLLLTTTGHLSGEKRKTPLLYLRDAARIVVVGSRGGRPKPPFWYLNLKVTPECTVLLDGEEIPYIAYQAQHEERERLWAKFVAFNPGFNTYQSRLERQIPVMVLEPNEQSV